MDLQVATTEACHLSGQHELSQSPVYKQPPMKCEVCVLVLVHYNSGPPSQPGLFFCPPACVASKSSTYLAVNLRPGRFQPISIKPKAGQETDR